MLCHGARDDSMAADLLLLHATDDPVASFNTLRDQCYPSKKLEHVVRTDWILRLRSEGATHQLTREIDVFVSHAEAPVMVTSPELGALATGQGALRADRPVLERAARSCGGVLLVSTHDTTASAQEALIQDLRVSTARATPILPLVLPQFEPILLSGDAAGFDAAVAAAVIEVLSLRPEFKTVVLGDLTMGRVPHLLDGCGAQVLAMPGNALEQAFETSHTRASLGEPITT